MLFQDVQDALVGSFAAGHINEKEFVILYEEYQSANLCFPYWEYQPFHHLDNSECRADFRVEKEDIPRFATALQFPPFFRCFQGTVCPGEGLCLLLRRLSYPCRYHDIIHQFA